MAKPILVIKLCVGGLPKPKAIEELHKINRSIQDQSIDEEYHVFILPVHGDSDVEVFYEKDFDEVKYEEIKKMIFDKLDSL